MKQAILILLLTITYCSYAQDKETQAQAMYMAAETAYNAGNYQRACDKLNEAEKSLGAGNAKIEYLRVKSLMEIKKYDDAKASMSKYFDYAKNNKGTDKYNEIMMLYANMDEASAEGSYTEGKRLYEEKSYKDAVEKLNYVKQVSPDKYKDIYRMLGTANSELGNYKEAAENYKVYAAQNPGDVSLQYILTEAQIEAGYFADAVKNIEAIKQKVGKDNFLKSMLLLSSYAYNCTKNYTQGIEDASQFISNSKYNDAKEQFVLAYILKSSGYLGLRKYDEAISSANYAIRCDKSNPNPYNQKAWVLYKKGDYKAALESAQDAISRISNNKQLNDNSIAAAYHTFAAIQYELEDYTSAMNAADKALSNVPQYIPAIDIMGCIMYKKGNIAEACKLWKDACERSSPIEKEELKGCSMLKENCK